MSNVTEVVECIVCGRRGALKVKRVGYFKCYYVDHGDVEHEVKCVEETTQ